MDSNHDKQIQRLLCYRYTIRQGGGLWIAPPALSSILPAPEPCLRSAA